MYWGSGQGDRFYEYWTGEEGTTLFDGEVEESDESEESEWG